MPEVIASPSVRRLAQEQGVDLEALAARLGRSTLGREDVLGTASVRTSSTGPNPWAVNHADFGPVRKEPLSRFARIAAENLGQANAAIPAVTHHDSADLTRIEALRADLRKEGRKVTALAFHVAVLARCLRVFPKFNASLSADGTTLTLKDYVHIGIAVDTEIGLMVPVVRNADELSISEIAAQLTDLSSRARARKIRPDEMGGASMSISNLGGLGGEAFTPIVNPPEVAILGLTRTEMRPVWNGEGFEPRPMVPLDLSYDHRVINGADAAKFLTRYRDMIADPDRLLLPG